MKPTNAWMEHWSDAANGSTPLAKHPHGLTIAGRKYVLGTDGNALCLIMVDEIPDTVPMCNPEKIAAVEHVLRWPIEHATISFWVKRLALRGWKVPLNDIGRRYGSIGDVGIDVDLVHYALGHLRGADPVRVQIFDGGTMREVTPGIKRYMPERGIAIYGSGWIVVVMGLVKGTDTTGEFKLPDEAAKSVHA